MKKVLILSVVALVILLAGGLALAKEKGKARDAVNQARTSSKKDALSEQDKQWKEQLKQMTPEQRRVAVAKKALDKELAPWLEVRKIALQEKATKTVAAIDKIVAEKQQQFKKKQDAMETDKPAKPKTEAKHSSDQETQRKKKAKNQD